MPIFRHDFRKALLASAGVLSLGCGDGGNGAGTRVETYPAFLPDAPQVVRGDAGAGLDSPTVRLITFAGDPLEAEIAGLLAQVRNPPSWTTTTHEYGVGPLSIGPSIVIDEAAPASVDSGQIESWLAAQLEGPHPDTARPDEQTIHLIVYPAPTTITSESQPVCGFHGHLDLPRRPVHCAAVVDCAPMLGHQDQLDAIGHTISHELIETATDPDFITRRTSGYGQVDSDHVAWQYFYDSVQASSFGGIEICDLSDEQLTLAELENAWSNAAIRAGHDPCVPAPSRPYFNAVPRLPDDVEVTWSSLPTMRTKGVIVPVGESRTIEVDLYSDGPIDSPWVVSAITQSTSLENVQVDGGANGSEALSIPVDDLSYSWDRTTGLNGEKLDLTITRVERNLQGSSVAALKSRSGDDLYFWPFVVGQ